MDIHFLINIIIGILFVSMIFSLISQRKPDLLSKKSRYEKVRELCKKKDGDLIGRRFQVPRENRESVAVNLYEPDCRNPVPVVYVMHGGNLLDGDADQTDTFCNRMSKSLNCMVVAVNYTKLDSNRPPYQQDEIIDTVLYFSKRSSLYNIDPSRTAFVGFSGGAYLMIGASAILATKGFRVRGMIAFYPLIDDSLIQLADQHLIVTPITFVTCDNETENRAVDQLCEHIGKTGTETDIRHYGEAKTGFIEVNNPEYEGNRAFRNRKDLYTEDQKEYAHICEIWMNGALERYFQE